MGNDREIAEEILEDYLIFLDSNDNKEIEKKITEALQAVRRDERERAKEYLKKICWTEKEIEAFDSWGRSGIRTREEGM